MKVLLIFIALPFGAAWAFGIGKGFVLRSRTGKLYILYGFIAGFFAGIASVDFFTGIKLGCLLALIAMVSGPYLNMKYGRNRRS
jgi:hypothetical protein